MFGERYSASRVYASQCGCCGHTTECLDEDGHCSDCAEQHRIYRAERQRAKQRTLATPEPANNEQEVIDDAAN